MNLSANFGGVAAVVARLAQPIAEEHELVLWDVRFVKEGAGWVLRILVDKPDAPVSINDCVAVSRKLSPILDEHDPIEQSYTLEVASPGIERELTRPAHFEYCAGWPVLVKLYQPFEGTKEFSGVLVGCEDGQITIEDGEQAITFDQKEIASVRVIDDFEPDEGE